MKISLHLKNKIAEIEKLTRAVDEFGNDNQVPGNIIHDITLALEEMISNIIYYAYEDSDGEHKIKIGLSIQDRQLRLKIEDDGKPFNPLQNPVPDVQKPLEERKIGGLGIYITRKLMDGLEYQRINDHNILIINVSLKGRGHGTNC